MKVILLEHTPDPERTVAAAARLCYSADDPDKLLEKLTDDKAAAFLEKLIGMGHMSPLEHVSFTFSVSGVSRACTHQLVRHRIASYSQRSQRYVKETQFAYVIPPTVQGNPEAKALYEKLMEDIQGVYNRMVEAGIPAEDARYVLPNGCETSIVVTMNARSLYNFFQHRCCTRAQWEIRGVANRMLQEVKQVAPRLFAKAGATCFTHLECHEGAMSCGLVDKLRAKAKGEEAARESVEESVEE